jgi:hypothetical protein
MSMFANIDGYRLVRDETKVMEMQDTIERLHGMINSYPHPKARQQRLRDLLGTLSLHLTMMAREADRLVKKIEELRGPE